MGSPTKLRGLLSGDQAEAPMLTLFGVPKLQVGRRCVVFTTERPFQLLAYLGCRRRWVPRDELADILYPNRDLARARSNLRKVILLAGRLAGVEFERNGDLLRWLPATDISAFEAAVEAGRLSDAIGMIVGGVSLLEGFDSAFQGVGATWLLGERQRIHSLWQSACVCRLAELTDRPTDAIRLARVMLERDPLDEAAVKSLAQAMLTLGDQRSATVALEIYAKRLAEDVGLEPPLAIRELTEASRTRSTQGTTPSRSTVLPDTTFIGRRAERAVICELLGQPGTRLVTITGPGGVGKTAIASQLIGWLMPAVFNSVVFVPLADLTDGEQVPGRIAERLGLMLSGDAAAWTQLAAAINSKSLALALDNVEHLDITSPIENLLAATSRLKIVMTSRTRLSIASETVVPLDGLPLPDEDETDADVLRCFDAMILLESRALAVSRKFNLKAQARGAVRLVRAVEGLPLAIELAAIWTRLLPADEIADEIVDSLELLGGDTESSRGLRASFAQSWRLLSPIERISLPRLAQLPGDFARPMAQQVAEVSLPVLAALVDKSLVRADGNGRFSMHPLIRVCALEHAPPGDELKAKHVAFMRDWMSDWNGEAASMQLLIARVILELPHVRAAWSWAVARADSWSLSLMCRPLQNFYEQQGLWTEGMAALGDAIDMLRRMEPVDERALGVVYRGLAILQHRMGAWEDGVESADEMLRVARSTENILLRRFALNMRGICLQKGERYEEARPWFERALAHSIEEGSAPSTAMSTGNLAATDACLGRYERANEGYERALNMYRDQVNDYMATTQLIGMSVLLRALGKPEEAVIRLNEALAECARHSFKAMRCTAALHLGLALYDLGQRDAGATWLSTALCESREHGDAEAEIQALLASVRLRRAGEGTAATRAQVLDALTKAERRRAKNLQAQCVAALGEILLSEERPVDGFALLEWAAAQQIDQISKDLILRRSAALRKCHQSPFESRTLNSDLPLQAVVAIAVMPVALGEVAI